MNKFLPTALIVGALCLYFAISRIIGLALFAYIAITVLVLLIEYETSCYKKISNVPMLKLLVDPGLYGEFKTVRAVEGISDAERVLVNVYLPNSHDVTETTEIDVIYINAAGVFVLESKNYSGWIFGNEKDKNWTQVLNKNTKNRFYNPIRQNAGHIKAVLALIGEDYSGYINNIVVFGNRSVLKDITITSNDVSVKNLSQLRSAIMSMSQSRGLSSSEINNIADKLKAHASVDSTTRQAHIDAVRIHSSGEHRCPAPAQADVPLCPLCGSPMVKRLASKGQYQGNEFWGCSTYPKCHGIINIS